MKNSLQAENPEQKEFIRSILEHPVTICTGRAGTGKSFVSVGLAAEKLYKSSIKRLIISRPLVCTGKSLPALPGTLEEKLDPYWIQYQDYLDFFLGKEKVRKLRQDNKIEFIPLEIMRGFNFRDTYLILTEAQNATYEQLEMLLTRIGDNTKIILDGDVGQSDIARGGECDLEKVIKRIENIEDVGFAHLVKSLRHPVVEKIARALE